MRYFLLLALLCWKCLLHSNGRRTMAPGRADYFQPLSSEDSESWSSDSKSTNSSSSESIEPYDPYIPVDSTEVHIKMKNISALRSHFPDMFATTPFDPYDESHLRYYTIYNSNPKPLMVFIFNHRVIENNKTVFWTYDYDFEIGPYQWSKNFSFNEKAYSSKGLDQFYAVVGYDGRNYTIVPEKRPTYPIPKLLFNETEYVQITIDLTNKVFILKPHVHPIITAPFEKYDTTVWPKLVWDHLAPIA